MYLYKAYFLVPEFSETLEAQGIEGYFYCIQVLPKACEGPIKEAISYKLCLKKHQRTTFCS